MSDAESPTNPNLNPGAQTDDFEAVEVFPESTDMDLRPGADNCYKCTACDVSCPVAEVDDEFPGPKFQGPEQWRLKRKDDEPVDDSIMSCSNCMRCDDACPSGVPLSQMHNTARGEYVEKEMDKLSREYIRNRILANYGTLAQLGSMFPRLTNAMMGNSLVQMVNEKVLGITSERDFPAFATQTFREWWNERGGPKVRSEEKRVAYFHGCYSNYNTPEVGKAMVRVFESFGYEVVVPKQRCSGTPMFANGMLEDAKRAAGINVENFSGLLNEGYDVIASCTSCSMSLRQEYPELFDIDGIKDVSEHTYEALEYLRIHENLEDELREVSVDDQSFAYHAPCHARNQGLDRQSVELFRELDGVEIEDVGDSCSGISGTYGWKEEKYDKSMQIAADMFDHMEHAQGDVGMTECPTCSMQMEHGTGYDIKHPLQLLEEALV
ncbi:anaerobic glycerol-3-phosphate dehydrogenase subunit C [Haloferax mediterranei ATCC 33500]|uniref:Glycerol-3-phosphate dehydrogenase n=1 Tax=Haloferax mediterranei (strain ATCC 33500 / DSM 1411 / JCM 8866 / NBRC 14739 / NCIMB 2177 / R-4) TaxID=523841 RepID=I3R4Z7_HALMT|nr:anaerobic glycerol-3-phosphate dehydrogenase subunit C [Haloferax mediterranei]AFK19307.1 glycerol-3-phosphate dehydrogenase subunit C [Haloferax mediterranei ATCC 33500]AHZ21336.1 glycerol-3-phosphate dehydrogenase [Haloferax mediterranei ATCC 33500]EMA04504.1 sn-glycerol-3-phosphate dehydrogenase subunit C [Haloferax mediterranei ATCC 33500]MDX5989411.1 anaerobic glycerol-3-phosphate dehydrogenase subunit C [Haloferax mediterranei ATCC 33500]QCQ75775.1 anaerobic glycerol-3-phosphate dehyd